MKFFDVLKMANTNLWRNKGRAILTILAIFVGSFTMFLTTGINYGVRDYADKQLANVGGEGYIEVIKSSEDLTELTVSMGETGPQEYDPNQQPIFSAMSPADIEVLRAVDGVESAEGMYNAPIEYIASSRTDKKYQLSAQEYLSDRLKIDMTSGRPASNQASDYEIMLAPEFAAALGYDDESIIGQTVTLGIPIQQLRADAAKVIQPLDVVVVGVQNKSIVSMGRSFVNKAAAQAIFELSISQLPAAAVPESIFSFAIVEIDPAAPAEEIDRIKAAIKEAGFAAMTIADSVNMALSIFDAITTILMIFGGVALLAAAIGIINTLFMAVQERTREIGLMKAMGLSNGKIFLMFSTEAILLGFWGSVVGVAIAFIARAVINGVASTTFLADLPGFVPVQFSVLSLLGVAALIMAIAFIAGTAPARRASKQNPIDALRYE